MRPIPTLIVDDERMARANLRVLLSRDREIEILGECGSGSEAARVIAAQLPELLFLDVEMPRMSGLDLLDALGRARRCAVVFVTAHEQYALPAFDAQALDYVLKPFDDRRFARALERAKECVRQLRLQELAAELAAVLPDRLPGPADEERIVVREGDRSLFVPLGEIDWIGADDYYVQLHVGVRSYLLREPLRDLEARLDPRRFVRIHRSAIVARDRVAALRGSRSGEPCVVLRDGTELKISRSRRALLRELATAAPKAPPPAPGSSPAAAPASSRRDGT
jgi:two-component system LytT family response regulator